MSQSDFVVAVVKKDLLSLWHEYWDQPTPSERARQLNRDGSLDEERVISAGNEEEAADFAESQNVGYVAIRNVTEETSPSSARV
jgi:hypothetical protein